MSQIYGAEAAQELVSIWQSFWVQNCCVVAALALIVYNHINTFTREVDLMWGRKLNSVTLLFHLNRWVTLMWAMVTLMYYNFLPVHVAVSSCIALNSFRVAIILFLLSVWAAFSSVRIYAVSGGNGLLALLVCALSMVPVGTNAFILLTPLEWQVDNSSLGAQCVDPEHVTESANTKLVVATRICLIASDLILLLVTWMKTYATKRQADQLNIKTPLATMLLRDGTLYFFGLLCLNIVNMVGQSTNVFVYAGGFTFPLSSIIVSDFLLKLRRVADDPSEETVESRSQPSTLRFASFVDNMGELLDYGYEHSDIDAADRDGGAELNGDSPGEHSPNFDEADNTSFSLTTPSRVTGVKAPYSRGW